MDSVFNLLVRHCIVCRKKREKYDSFLQTVQILQSMDPYERSKLGDAVREERFKNGDYVITQGDAGDKFFILDEGTAIATKTDSAGSQTKVMDYVSGSYFGEKALLLNDVRAANIIVTSEECLVLSLDRATFKRLLGPLDDILKRNMELYNKY